MENNIVTYSGLLEIDYDRGVLYFHNAEKGNTILRICQMDIPRTAPKDKNSIFMDITKPNMSFTKEV